MVMPAIHAFNSTWTHVAMVLHTKPGHGESRKRRTAGSAAMNTEHADLKVDAKVIYGIDEAEGGCVICHK